MTEITRVYVDMVVDLFHYGHVNFLLVGVHSDETVESLTQLASLHQTVSCTYELNPRTTGARKQETLEGQGSFTCRFVDEWAYLLGFAAGRCRWGGVLVMRELRNVTRRRCPLPAASVSAMPGR